MFVTSLSVYPIFLSQTAIRFLLFLLFSEYEKCVVRIFLKRHEGFISFLSNVDLLKLCLILFVFVLCVCVFLAAQVFPDMR